MQREERAVLDQLANTGFSFHSRVKVSRNTTRSRAALMERGKERDIEEIRYDNVTLGNSNLLDMS